MDPSLSEYDPSVEEHEWDSDDFVIPNLSVGEPDLVSQNAPEVSDPQTPSKVIKREEKIYLGPHGAPPSQTKQQEPIAGGHKQRFKQKLKEADRRFGGTGRENKVESLRELVGSKSTSQQEQMTKRCSSMASVTIVVRCTENLKKADLYIQQ
ncbi:uncharacterized protein LOC120276766 isoform X2 [Dioscorea cayenensis subsp. rotundata]|uniref:Uncharacterized protein LOC120276766 isoform X2 n=1 Tax=Dioscorea cayennensis subsp. rotundata TaxID=55577 RepID=A0AB40CJX4_DIOCR|nr:uncharacterized protein LOC120276766 isoform X2 [Dioscorea cayenensis subsp. rotundata]